MKKEGIQTRKRKPKSPAAISPHHHHQASLASDKASKYYTSASSTPPTNMFFRSHTNRFPRNMLECFIQIG